MTMTPKFEQLPLTQIHPSKTNPRKYFDEVALSELAESIKTQGVAQPILVRPKKGKRKVPVFEIIAGERRYRASKLAGMETIPALIRELTDQQALEIQVIENLQRADLHPIEEAEGYEQLMKLHDLTADDLVAKVGKSRSYVYGRLKLLSLEHESREAFYEGKLNPSTALLVARIPVKKLQTMAVEEITAEGWYGDSMSFRMAKKHIQDKYMLQLVSAPFSTGDEALLPEVGSCSSCPKRTGNQPELFADVESTDVCTDPDCFALKKAANITKLKESATEKQEIITGKEAKKMMPWGIHSLPSNGYIALDDVCSEDDEGRSFRDILGQNTPTIHLIENQQDGGKMIEIIKTEEVRPLLENAGITLEESNTQNNAREHAELRKKQEADRQAEKEHRLRLLHALRDASTDELEIEHLRDIAFKLARQLNTEEEAIIIEIYCWPPSFFDYDKKEELKQELEKFDERSLRRLLCDLNLVDDIHEGLYWGTPERSTKLIKFSSLIGLDLESICLSDSPDAI